MAMMTLSVLKIDLLFAGIYGSAARQSKSFERLRWSTQVGTGVRSGGHCSSGNSRRQFLNVWCQLWCQLKWGIGLVCWPMCWTETQGKKVEHHLRAFRGLTISGFDCVALVFWGVLKESEIQQALLLGDLNSVLFDPLIVLWSWPRQIMLMLWEKAL